MKQLRHHAVHLLMCAPILVVAIALLVSGAGLASLLPAVACVAMMVAMMAVMGAARSSRR